LSRVAKRYAKAIFELSIEENVFESTEAELRQIGDAVKENSELENFLKNPLISHIKKSEIVEQLFKDHVSELTYRFLVLVAKKGRLAFLGDIVDYFRRFALVHRNQVEGELVSAVSLSDEQVGKIRKIIEDMTGKIVLFTEKIDTDILGGFVVRVEDKLVDMSVRSSLEQMKKKLIAG
jgi:F-type H+-transporting ATPase subunit delta